MIPSEHGLVVTWACSMQPVFEWNLDWKSPDLESVLEKQEQKCTSHFLHLVCPISSDEFPFSADAKREGSYSRCHIIHAHPHALFVSLGLGPAG